MPKSKKINQSLSMLPSSPGIYKFLNKEDEILYIGKAKDLNKRVRHYSQKSIKHSVKTQKMVSQIEKIEFIEVDSELEAMILETNLIKKFKPKYNVLMKDGKNYVYIKISNEDFPRIQIVRELKKDKAKYIGPKTAAYKVKETFKILKKLFPFRHCNLGIKYDTQNKDVKITNKVIKYPCLDYYIKRCAAPCINKCSKSEYENIVKNVEDFLEGRTDDILKDLQIEMKVLAKNKQFEAAAKVRDKIEKITSILERQKVSDPNQVDSDIINYIIIRDKAFFNLFQVRDGKLLGQENFTLSANLYDDNSEVGEVLNSFLQQYYSLATNIPSEILLPHKIESQKTLQQLIKKEHSKNVKISFPKKGKKDKLLRLSLKNAQIFADRSSPRWQQESALTLNAAKKLAKTLNIKEELKRIECYDISHLSGKETVGSMIVFKKGIPAKNMYRKFKIRTLVNKADDYKSLEEVLTRRFSKISDQVRHKDFLFKKARKTDMDFILKHNKKNSIKNKKKNFFILENKKKPAGFIAVTDHAQNVSELTNLWVKKKHRGKKIGYKLIKNAIKKAKSKRVYGIIKDDLKEYYLLFGFEIVKKVPSTLKKRYENIKKDNKIVHVIVYDKNKHKEDKSFIEVPSLIIIDGGKGQLTIATKVLKNLKLKIPHISIAKKMEEIFIPNKKTSILLDKNNDALKLIQRARDEAHRFAISYNRKLRQKSIYDK